MCSKHQGNASNSRYAVKIQKEEFKWIGGSMQIYLGKCSKVQTVSGSDIKLSSRIPQVIRIIHKFTDTSRKFFILPIPQKTIKFHCCFQEEPFKAQYLRAPSDIKCCATNRKVAGSIPANVSGFFFDIKSFRSHYGPGVYSASNRNEYQEYFLGVKAAGA